MRLRKLELQGYKSFATKTEFVFDHGVTAIVGPNGSGKSNIADAVRWILGEQSYRLLRAKRTEDMIFSGSAQRARAGMAQGTITLDNSEGWLPVDYSEVSITRRAYRSGENEYYLNGNRVRLREINELLGRSGLARRTYSVIGQGMIDAALALNPEERRALFEEAAGIAIHQLKRAEALAKLEATQANLLRINDIIAEITPSLRNLRAQAEKAERHAEISAQLNSLLRTWYGYRWHLGQVALTEAQQVLQQRAEAVAKCQKDMEQIEQRIAALRAEQAGLRQELGEWHRQSSRLHADAESLERELAVWQERARHLTHQGDEIAQELTSLRAVAKNLEEGIAESEAVLAEIEAQRGQYLTQIAEVEAQVHAREREHQAVLKALLEAREEAFRVATEAADRRNRLSQLDERERELHAEREEHHKRVTDCQKEIGELERQIRSVKTELDVWLEASAVLEKQQKEALEVAGRLAAARPALDDALAKAKTELARLNARYELLSRMREDMEGYYAGVRSVMRSGIAGIIGPVASLITVEPSLERAIETALGGHLQDLIVERWEVAEKAIEHLKRTRAGRATFLPLDTVRPANPLRAPAKAGIIGLGAELVEYAPQLRPAITMLLGRTLVVENLQVARQVMRELQGPFQIVTPAGEIVRSTGAVSGGASQREDQGGMLAREREWRELPALLEEAKNHVEHAQKQLQENQKEEARHRQMAESLAKELLRRRQQQDNLTKQMQELRRQQDRFAQEAEWHQHGMEQLAGELKALGAKRDELHEELQRLQESQTALDEQLRTLQRQEAELSADDTQLQLSHLRSVIAVLDSKRESQHQIIRNQRASLQRTLEQITAKQQRLEELQAQQQSLMANIEEAVRQREAQLAELSAIEKRIAPAEARLAELESSLTKLYADEERLRQKLRDAESRHGQASLEYQRQKDRAHALYRQIEEDLGLAQVEPIEGVAEQIPLPLHPLVSELPVVKQLPEGLEEEINRLRAQLHRLGTVNPQAPEEYAALLQRHSFLTEQVADLEQASRSLRAVIAELDELMERDFMQTFRAVAGQFKEYFTMLFGGGSAQLVLTDPDNLAETGVDIVVRPPGKRQQSLALLSGGERALTAAALIFAILKVSPTYFCFLDEVDAMLDEANIGRFCEALKTLSNQTQFIVITHNRGTVEIADTIYGITMGEDGASRAISLRLEGKELRPAAAD